jgi:hypothetical protein
MKARARQDILFSLSFEHGFRTLGNNIPASLDILLRAHDLQNWHLNKNERSPRLLKSSKHHSGLKHFLISFHVPSASARAPLRDIRDKHTNYPGRCACAYDISRTHTNIQWHVNVPGLRMRACTHVYRDRARSSSVAASALYFRCIFLSHRFSRSLTVYSSTRVSFIK